MQFVHRKEESVSDGSREDGPAPRRHFAHLIDRLFAMRDRILGNARFQRFAAGFPLTRPIARKQATKLFDICAGFVYSQVLAACIELRLFELVRDQPRTAAELSARCNIPLEAMQRLLIAAVSLRLLAKRSGGRYGVGMLGAALTANPGIAAMVRHHAMLYEDLRDPVALLRGGCEQTQLSRFWAYAERPPAAPPIDEKGVSGYTALMASSQAMIADDILTAYDFRGHRHLLDVGGGDGAFLLAAAHRAPALRMTLFDLPPVAAMAETTFRDKGIADRAQAIAGNFLQDRLPAGADLITLNRILLDHDDVTVLTILGACRKALAPGGVLLIAEPVSGLTGSDPVSDAYFGLYLFAMGRGRTRSYAELKHLLHQSGFYRVTRKKTRRPLLTNLLQASPKPDTICDNLY